MIWMIFLKLILNAQNAKVMLNLNIVQDEWVVIVEKDIMNFVKYAKNYIMIIVMNMQINALNVMDIYALIKIGSIDLQ